MATACAMKKEKTSRIDLRLTDQQRLKYEKAAALKGQNLTQWASAHLDSCASRDIAEASATRLDDEAFEYFCTTLDAPMPKEALDLLQRKPIWE